MGSLPTPRSSPMSPHTGLTFEATRIVQCKVFDDRGGKPETAVDAGPGTGSDLPLTDWETAVSCFLKYTMIPARSERAKHLALSRFTTLLRFFTLSSPLELAGAHGS